MSDSAPNRVESEDLEGLGYVCPEHLTVEETQSRYDEYCYRYTKPKNT